VGPVGPGAKGKALRRMHSIAITALATAVPEVLVELEEVGAKVVAAAQVGHLL
jgi:hypothetical protein